MEKQECFSVKTMILATIKYALIVGVIFLLLTGIISGDKQTGKIGVYLDHDKLFNIFSDKVEHIEQEIKPHKIIG